MKILILLGSAILPTILYFSQKSNKRFEIVFNLCALLSLVVFGNILALSIYNVIKNNTVLMTDIHAILLNPFFLITGAYLGIYLIYMLLKTIGISRGNNDHIN
ncbi:MAG: transposase [Bacillota bacterium]|uniref:Transposase n=1 Tax=Virgibacillus salarius TaxID=447199 RepID=A0A941IDA7_9BACI|nr:MULTISPECIES: hypothetical protein [Bacillaceae]MBR7798212.1 transposase [Virgibacillus salarius]MCC2251470.1 transposase [Virgibacillus sp. AGTR]MDY7045820.1 transposase [Virgibacillus sp. M23]NAZ10920.1 transposase [Agaribacter marinus]